MKQWYLIPIRDPNIKFSWLQKIRGGGGKKWVSVLYTVLIWSCIDHVINMIDQARYRWEKNNSGILSKQNLWRSNVYSSFFFNRARFPLARLPFFTLWALLLYKINISFALGHRFLSEATQIQPRGRIIIRGYPEDTGIKKDSFQNNG